MGQHVSFSFSFKEISLSSCCMKCNEPANKGKRVKKKKEIGLMMGIKKSVRWLCNNRFFLVFLIIFMILLKFFFWMRPFTSSLGTYMRMGCYCKIDRIERWIGRSLLCFYGRLFTQQKHAFKLENTFLTWNPLFSFFSS